MHITEAVSLVTWIISQMRYNILELPENSLKLLVKNHLFQHASIRYRIRYNNKSLLYVRTIINYSNSAGYSRSITG
jgi:hypothetical protein